MRRGSALTDAERAPWLASLHAVIAAAIDRREPLVVACSSLKQRYRDVLRGELRTVRFVYLKAAEALLHQRLEQREGHFAGPSLLASQLATLEEPADALTLTVDASRPPDEIVARIGCEFGL
jgi:gluconokinase